ncbi:hypothetical protein DICVIV_11871 [Dictyocaulus viviparus]|uniref:NOG1 N-terminal helical domain-containing protein n=1 Tax=Dictyocaulus viviparus TaxID=29172 RepID=A0A0D8XBZ1_DICVI|nr:hypothetical protein DICVIV_11871 [Dictyocaulus viviparus]
MIYTIGATWWSITELLFTKRLIRQSLLPMQYNFKRITVVPTALNMLQELKEIVLSKTQRKTPTVIHRQYAIGRIRSFYARKIKFLQQTLHDKLTQIINEFQKWSEAFCSNREMVSND